MIIKPPKGDIPTRTSPSRLSQSYPRDPQADLIDDIQAMAAHFAARHNAQSPTHVRLYASPEERAAIAQETGLVVLLMGEHYNSVIMERMEE